MLFKSHHLSHRKLITFIKKLTRQHLEATLVNLELLWREHWQFTLYCNIKGNVLHKSLDTVAALSLFRESMLF